jgi:hypothetical protein
MKSTHRRTMAVVLLVCAAAATAWAVDRAWQKGTWRDVQVKRPKVVFGVAPNNPNSGAPRTSPPAAQEVRTYVIETDTMRYELKENVTVDTPRIDVLVGEPVEFAIEKKTAYVKDQDGHEHRLSVVKESKK